MDESRLIRKGPLFYRLVRKYVEEVGIRVQREGDGALKIRLVAGGPWFFFLEDEFDEAVEEMRKYDVQRRKAVNPNK